jgi:hypothetical protein
VSGTTFVVRTLVGPIFKPKAVMDLEEVFDLLLGRLGRWDPAEVPSELLAYEERRTELLDYFRQHCLLYRTFDYGDTLRI